MGTTSDRVLGAGLVAFSGAVFAYYSVWVLVLPFVDPTHPFHNYFPPAEWAIRGPVLLLVLGVGGVGALRWWEEEEQQRRRGQGQDELKRWLDVCAAQPSHLQRWELMGWRAKRVGVAIYISGDMWGGQVRSVHSCSEKRVEVECVVFVLPKHKKEK
ncbi:dolichol phosphate-mannose biosynthesis regulatory protein-domain-containing protein [Powellomyces hirtus]|nr:dolichol phosphate-mannose biosynthesis regulatory protein-domain-containing protein [Powellomyces hirtus]